MTKADIPACMELKAAAGWNQTTVDWECVIDLQPDGCWVDEREGQVAGSTTVVCYGMDLAWIGMVLTLPSFRRRGIARGLMEHALAFCDQRGVGVVKLDATDMGRPLYAKLGFVDEQPIERWRSLPSRARQQPVCAELTADRLLTGAAQDQRAFGVDRGGAFERLAIASTERFGDSSGYVLARPGANAHFIGPCVAESSERAKALIRAVLTRRPNSQFFWDLLPKNQPAVELAQSLGFEPARELTRMARPGGRPLFGDQSLIWATAGFEYG